MAHSVCPVWFGHFLASPLRRLIQNPEKILAPYISHGMSVLDIGCAMGYFSLPLARMVGEQGKVICIDVQEKMIQSLVKRAKKAGLLERVEPRICPSASLGINDLSGRIDFALAFAVVHEVPDKERLFQEIYQSLKENGVALIAEPKGIVPYKEWMNTVTTALNSGFIGIEHPPIKKAYAIALRKTAG
jgi:ubiquinone/menaquinone biosynthesis C-methylase UbiE